MNEKKIACMIMIGVVAFIWVCGWNYVFGFGQGLDDLADKTADGILGFFKDKYNVKTSIIRFENLSGISGLTAQRFYQLLVSKIETADSITYTDLMVNFQQNKGVFNLNRIHPLNYLVYIKLTRDKTKIGAGISIFSRTLDKVVYIKYFAALFTAPEREVYEVDRYGFKDTGFSKIMEMNARRDLLDAKSFPDLQGKLKFLFYYPDRIEFFRAGKNRLDRFLTYKIKWKPPYYPVMEHEGKLSVFFTDTDANPALYITVGGNFSGYAKVLVFKNDRWEEAGTVNALETDVDFVPFRLIELNHTRCLAGARWAVGKNYFQGRVILLPLASFAAGETPGKDPGYLEKEVPPFYSLDFSSGANTNVLNSIHLVDRDYRYRFLADNFEESTVEEERRGASLCCLNGQWLAVSAFSRGTDTLYFYKIESGARQQVFENQINGEVIFISDGYWKTARGFWVCVKTKTMKARQAAADDRNRQVEYKLQFWSKKSE